jgi:hypothetical protein
MSDFFEPPPAPPASADECFRRPPWVGPPEGTLPGVVALELVLARNETAAVCVTRLAGYPAGFEFELITMMAPRQNELELDPMLFRPHRRRARRGEGLDPELLRIGVQFADGAKATNTGGFHAGQDPPDAPVMHPGGGGGGGGRWRQEMWVWPLPPPGPVAFVCEWPAAGIPLSRAELDAQVILDAAGRAQVIFPEDPGHTSSGGGWTSYAATQTSRAKPQPRIE